jgi:hypothetical protein
MKKMFGATWYLTPACHERNNAAAYLNNHKWRENMGTPKFFRDSGAGGGGGSGGGGSITSALAAVPQQRGEYYERQMLYSADGECVHFPGESGINGALRRSSRVEELPSLQAGEFRIVPTSPYNITNFASWRPRANPAHLNLEGGGVAQHPADWVRVSNLQERRALDIGAALFCVCAIPRPTEERRLGARLLLGTQEII